MSVKTSESTASIPVPIHPNIRVGVPQNQYVYVIFINNFQKEYAVLNMNGAIIKSSPFENGADEVIKFTDDNADGLPVALMNGEYKFSRIKIKGQLYGVNAKLTGDIELDGGSLFNLGCDNITADSGDIHGVEADTVMINNGWIESSEIHILHVNKSSDIRVRSNRISEFNFNQGKRAFVIENQIERFILNGVTNSIISNNSIEIFVKRECAMNVISSNIIGGQLQVGRAENLAFTPIETKPQKEVLIPTEIKTGWMPITSESGGTRLPDIYISHIKLWIPNVTFKDQKELEPDFFVGGVRENAPYFDREARPQINGYPLSWPTGKIELNVKNMADLRVVSTVSGAYIAYFGV